MSVKTKKKRVNKENLHELFPRTREENAERRMSRVARNHIRLGRYYEALKELWPPAFKQMTDEQKMVFQGVVTSDIKGGSLIVYPNESETKKKVAEGHSTS